MKQTTKAGKTQRIKETSDFYNFDGSVKPEYRTTAIKHINATNIKAMQKAQSFTTQPHSIKASKVRKVEERKGYRPIEETFADMEFNIDMAHRLEQHADLVHDYMNKYFEVSWELICRKAIKLLHKVNVVIEPKRYTETLNEARIIMYEELAMWKDYKRKDTNAAGEEVETVYEAWYELPARMLFYVLADRVQRRLRKYVFNADNLNNQIALDSIAESMTAEDMITDIEQRLDSSAARLGNMDYLKTMLSAGQYKALQDYITGKAQGNGGAYDRMKKAIRAGRLNADELRDLLPLVKAGNYEVTQMVEFEYRKGLAQIMRKLG